MLCLPALHTGNVGEAEQLYITCCHTVIWFVLTSCQFFLQHPVTFHIVMLLRCSGHGLQKAFVPFLSWVR